MLIFTVVADWVVAMVSVSQPSPAAICEHFCSDCFVNLSPEKHPQYSKKVAFPGFVVATTVASFMIPKINNKSKTTTTTTQKGVCNVPPFRSTDPPP